MSQKPIRICFVVEDLLPAGTELWIIRLIERLDQTKVQPYLCLLNGTSSLSRSLEPTNCPVLRLKMKKMRSRQGLKAAHEFYRFLKHHDIDIVQVHHADPTYFAAPIARLVGVNKVVQTKYDVGFWLSSTDKWLHRLYRLFVDITIANCQACRVASIQQEWSRPTRVVVVENGIPLDELRSVPDLHMPQHGSIHVGMVGNLKPVKNPSLLVDAAAISAQRYPQLCYHIAGTGNLFETVMQRVRTLGLKDRFFLHGSVQNIPTFLAQQHIAVLCSDSEGLPHALLEYMAAGRAIVATQVGGNVELIEHETTGQLVPPKDASALAAAIGRYVEEPKFAERVARQARDHVADRYSFESMVQRFEEFYRRVVSEKPRVGSKHLEHIPA